MLATDDYGHWKKLEVLWSEGNASGMRTATRLSVARWAAASRTKPSEFPQHEAKSRALGVAGPWLRAKLRERESVRGHGRIASRWGPGKRSERRELLPLVLSCTGAAAGKSQASLPQRRARGRMLPQSRSFPDHAAHGQKPESRRRFQSMAFIAVPLTTTSRHRTFSASAR